MEGDGPARRSALHHDYFVALEIAGGGKARRGGAEVAAVEIDGEQRHPFVRPLLTVCAGEGRARLPFGRGESETLGRYGVAVIPHRPPWILDVGKPHAILETTVFGAKAGPHRVSRLESGFFLDRKS